MNVFITLFLIALFLANCTSVPSNGVNFKNINLTVTNFISDCKAGDISIGTGINDVMYDATIVVSYSPSNNNSYIPHMTYTQLSPSGPNRGTFTKTIEIPTNKTFKIEVTINATECSICALTGCALSPQLIGGIEYYFVNRPYWKSSSVYANFSPNSLTFTPQFMPRTVPVTCPCQVKKN